MSRSRLPKCCQGGLRMQNSGIYYHITVICSLKCIYNPICVYIPLNILFRNQWENLAELNCYWLAYLCKCLWNIFHQDNSACISVTISLCQYPALQIEWLIAVVFFSVASYLQIRLLNDHSVLCTKLMIIGVIQRAILRNRQVKSLYRSSVVLLFNFLLWLVRISEVVATSADGWNRYVPCNSGGNYWKYAIMHVKATVIQITYRIAGLRWSAFGYFHNLFKITQNIYLKNYANVTSLIMNQFYNVVRTP